MQRLSLWLKNGDQRMLYYLNLQVRCSFLDWWLPRITHLGGASFTVGFFILSLFISLKLGSEGLIALTASHLCVQILKRSFNRFRPYLTNHGLFVAPNPLTDYSFPSGHSTAICSLVTTLSLFFPWMAVLCFPLAFLVGISRIYLGLHYPTDVAIGALIGIGSAIGTHLLFTYHLPF